MMNERLRLQSGVTLMSLMIGMAMGIFVVGAAIKIYTSTKESFVMRNVIAEVSENKRFAIDDMRRILVMAGRGIAAVEDSNVNRRAFPRVSTSYSTAKNAGAAFIFDAKNTDESDIIAVRYRVGPSCGSYQNISKTARPSMVRFLVANDQLICELTVYEPSQQTTRATLIDGVERMRVLYGVDDDGDRYANRYLTASEVENLGADYNSTWGKVVSARVGFIVKSDTKVPPSARVDTAPKLNLLGMEYTAPDTEYLRSVTVTTLAFRNLNPSVQRQ